MDPNATLAEMREQMDTVFGGNAELFEEAAVRLAELGASLDEWLSRGGFLPDDWVPKATSRPLTDEEYLERWGD